MIAYMFLFRAPIAARSLNHRMNSPGHFALSFPTVIVASLILGPLAFNQFPRWSDLLVAGLLYVGVFPFPAFYFLFFQRSCTARNVPREFGYTDISPEDADFEIDQTLYEDDTFESGIAQDILFLVSQFVLYACADAVWSLDE